MAEKHFDILRSLRSWDIMPPKDLFKKIWSIIKEKSDLQNNEALSKLSFATVESAENGDEDQYAQADVEIFRSLQNHSLTPPDFSTLNIEKYIGNRNVIKPAAKIISFKYFGRAAAAVLIIACGLWFAYHKTQPKNDNEFAANNTQKNVAAPSVNSAATNVNQTNSSGSNLVAAVSGYNKNTDYTKKINALKGSNATSGELIDNDILLTLVSYNYTKYLPLLNEIEKNNKITIDRFSYVTVSDKMHALLQKMYATNRHNRPTRKAKKLKATLEKWKKKDESHFDSDASANPIDVIDLSEFILK